MDHNHPAVKNAATILDQIARRSTDPNSRVLAEGARDELRNAIDASRGAFSGDLDDKATELTASFINGNLTAVVDEIAAMPPAVGLELTCRVTLNLRDEGESDASHIFAFLKLLSDRV